MKTIQPLFDPKSPQARLSRHRLERERLKAMHQHDPQSRKMWKTMDGLLASQEAAALNKLKRSHV